jgi:hypothetical protein
MKILDNKLSGIIIVNNLIFHIQIKYIEVWYHYIGEKLVLEVEIKHVFNIDKLIVIFFIKPLGKIKFVSFNNKLEYWAWEISSIFNKFL